MNDSTTHLQNAYLDFLWLEITPRCNLECIHCYAESSPHAEIFGNMRTDDWLQVIEEAANIGCRHIQFIGGEPTLHPHLERLISFAYSNNYEYIEVFTNATTLSSRLLQIFAKHNVHMATSFYSDDSETHDSITSRKGSFNRTMLGIRNIIDAGLALRVGIIEMEENVGHAPRAKRLLEELGVAEIHIDRQRSFGRGTRAGCPLDPMSELCGQCWKGKLCITSEGKAYPCTFARFVELGSVHKGIRNIVMSSALFNFRSSLREEQEVEFEGSDRPCRPTCSPPVEFCVPKSGPCQPDGPCIPLIKPQQ